MAITYEELHTSREKTVSVTEHTLTRVFMIYGTDDPDEAENIGPQLNEYWNDELRVVERRFAPVKPSAAGTEGGVLLLTVTYQFRPVFTPGQPDEFALNVGTTSERIFKTPPKQTIYGVAYNALSQLHYGVPGLDFDKDEPGDLIVVEDSPTRKVEGVDVLIPTMEWSETHERSSLPVGFQQIIARLTTKVNHDTWRGWPARTWLFLGAVASRRKGENWRITFNFRISNAVAMELTGAAGAITPFLKEGHDLVWFRYTELLGASGNVIDRGIRDAHVARVYQDADFTELGIGSEAMS